MATKEMEKPVPAEVPDLVRTPALEIDPEDVALPKLKLGQYSADAVKAQLVKPGTLFTTVGKDDPDPEVLWSPGDKEGVVFYVLGVRKGWSYSAPGQELETWAFNDPSRNPDAWVTYTYTVAIPSEDEDVPFTFLLTRTGKPAARQINTALVKSGRPPWYTAFSVTTKEKNNPKGDYFVPVVTTVEPDEAAVKAAEKMAVMVAGQSAEFNATNEEPEI